MIIKGKYNVATIFTDNIDDACIKQIKDILNCKSFKDSLIKIMPDCHAGKGCVIGFTMTITDKIVPNLIGVDIGCGMSYVNLGKIDLDLKKLDNIINSYIPAGFNVYYAPISYCARIEKQLNGLTFELKNKAHIENSLGTLGGGNHFIEVDIDNDGNKYLVVHSGSRNLGVQVYKHHQNIAYKLLNNKDCIKNMIEKLKSQGREKEIQDKLKNIKKISLDIPKELTYLQNNDFYNYINDMHICQDYAKLNRFSIILQISNYLNLNITNIKHTMHNYISDDNIIRKGSISAKKGEEVLIPLNMRDGSLLCIGKGNKEWNYSAPHGAGRMMSRSKAKENISLSQFKKSMEGIYSTSICESTIDESPFAYKSDIDLNITDTVSIIKRLKPIYNFKAK